VGSDTVAEPLFILAPARSGSSVVCAMLGRHPSLYDFPELRLFRADTVGGLLVEPAPGEGMPARDRTAGLVRALAQLHEGEQSEAAVDRAFRWLQVRARWPVAVLLEHLLELAAPLVGVEKSPETSTSDVALRRMVEARPRARCIHLVRHPWSTVASMVEAWRGLAYWKVPPERAAEHCLTVWYRQHRRIAAFGAGLRSERFLRVRAEDVVNSAAETLPAICRWLAVDGGDESIRRMMAPERSCYAVPGPANAAGGYDAKFLERPQLRPLPLPSPLTPAEVATCNPQLRAAVVDLAGRFGYRAEHAPAAPAQVFRLRRRRRLAVRAG
jgi:hypothetical protein